MGTIASLAQNAFGAFGDSSAQDYEQRAWRQKKAAEEKARGIGDSYYAQTEGEYAPEAATYLSDVNKWRGAAEQMDPEYQKFDDSQYTVGRYLDPGAEFEQQQAARQVQQSQAARGGLLSGGAALELQKRSQGIASQQYGRAQDTMFRDRDFGLSDYRTKYQADLDRIQGHRTNLADMARQSGTARQNLIETRGGRGDLNMSSARTQGDYDAGGSMSRGKYIQGQFNRAGNAAGQIVGSAEAAYPQAFSWPGAK